MCAEPVEPSCCSETDESPVKEKFESAYDECCSTEITDSNLDIQISASQKILVTTELAVVTLLTENLTEEISTYSNVTTDTSPPLRGIPVYLFHNILLI